MQYWTVGVISIADFVGTFTGVKKMNCKVENKEKKSLREDVANKLQVERWFAKMSQQELADKLDTTKSSISRLESGRQNLTLDYVEAIAQALGKEVNFNISDIVEDIYGDSTDYSLKLYDETLLKFKLTRDYGLICEIQWINEERKHLLPLDLELTNDGVIKWLRGRVIPSNRDMVKKVLATLKLELSDLKGLIDICMGLSLNDSYWVVANVVERQFEEYNLYENRFTEALSLVAYTGWGYDGNNFKTSPELTTGGMLRKCWRMNSKKEIWLYKGGTEGFANTGNEPYSEFYASQIAEQMGLKAVKYDLENLHGILASKCKLFTDIDTSYIPIGRIVKEGGIDAVIDYYKQLGEEYYQNLASMLVFDAVIMNEDRHYGNFGLLRDNHTGKIIDTAPVFDNGISLLCYAMKMDFDDNLDEYVNTRSNPYGFENNYYALAKKVMGHRQKEELRRLIGFTFEESDVTNLPSWRTGNLEKVVQKRVAELLSL